MVAFCRQVRQEEPSRRADCAGGAPAEHAVDAGRLACTIVRRAVDTRCQRCPGRSAHHSSVAVVSMAIQCLMWPRGLARRQQHLLRAIGFHLRRRSIDNGQIQEDTDAPGSRTDDVGWYTSIE